MLPPSSRSWKNRAMSRAVEWTVAAGIGAVRTPLAAKRATFRRSGKQVLGSGAFAGFGPRGNPSDAGGSPSEVLFRPAGRRISVLRYSASGVPVTRWSSSPRMKP